MKRCVCVCVKGAGGTGRLKFKYTDVLLFFLNLLKRPCPHSHSFVSSALELWSPGATGSNSSPYRVRGTSHRTTMIFTCTDSSAFFGLFFSLSLMSRYQYDPKHFSIPQISWEDALKIKLLGQSWTLDQKKKVYVGYIMFTSLFQLNGHQLSSWISIAVASGSKTALQGTHINSKKVFVAPPVPWQAVCNKYSFWSRILGTHGLLQNWWLSGCHSDAVKVIDLISRQIYSSCAYIQWLWIISGTTRTTYSYGVCLMFIYISWTWIFTSFGPEQI